MPEMVDGWVTASSLHGFRIQLPLCMLKKIMEKVAEGLGIECGGLFGQKTSCFQVECPKETHLLTS
jgi:hypothetical protein